MTTTNDIFLTTVNMSSIITTVVLTVIAVILGIACFVKTYDADYKGLAGICAILVIAVCVMCGIHIYKNGYKKDLEVKEYGQARTKYAIYLNGIEVDYDKVCISDYNVKYNDTAKEIYLSPKKK